MRLAGHDYVYRNGGLLERHWSVRIPISPRDSIELTREFGIQSQHTVVAPFADAVRKTLEPELAAFSVWCAVIPSGTQIASELARCNVV
jgi:hypothetical protein